MSLALILKIIADSQDNSKLQIKLIGTLRPHAFFLRNISDFAQDWNSFTDCLVEVCREYKF